MNAQQKTLAVVLGGAFATALAFSPLANADMGKSGNPFAMNALAKGIRSLMPRTVNAAPASAAPIKESGWYLL